MQKLKSLSIFFPFYNDAGTVKEAITLAYKYGGEVASKLEVVAIHGGNSGDETYEEIKKMQKKFRDLLIVDKTTNKESYAVIKHGFYKATKSWVFYTDGDLQYDLADLKKLVQKQISSGASVINGYRVQRNDNLLRITLGFLYSKLTKSVFELPIRDLACDFRLIENKYLKKIKFKAGDASILLELIKKLESAGAKFEEVRVKHKPRKYGHSSYNLLKLLKERVLGDVLTWKKLRKENV